MADTNPTSSVTTIKLNRINVPIKRQSLEKWIQKHDPAIDCMQETHLRFKDTTRLKKRTCKQ